MVICDGRRQDVGGVKVVLRARVVVGCVRPVARGCGVWRATRCGDIAAMRDVCNSCVGSRRRRHEQRCTSADKRKSSIKARG